MTRCSNAKRYKGKKKPKCLGGKVCDTCAATWSLAQANRRLDRLITGEDRPRCEFKEEMGHVTLTFTK